MRHRLQRLDRLVLGANPEKMKAVQVNARFARLGLAELAAELRQRGASVGDGWVHHCSTGQWEFHYRKFYWHGRAEGAQDARAKGWAAWLKEAQ